MNMEDFWITALTDGTRLLSINPAVYRLSAVQKAAYKYSGHFHVLINQSETVIEVRLQPKEGCTSPEIAARDFANEILDQELREVVATETEAVRNLILAQAFSKTSLINAEEETSVI
jgi:His-Xaa-Ser system protein HxsD